MRRSEINHYLDRAKAFFADCRFALPGWANWSPDDWLIHQDMAGEIFENQLGWDLTDFGLGNYERAGLLLFTLRNGNPARDRKTYAEKIMIVGENQETPLHFHWRKMEDIINRGGGNLVLELCHATEDEQPDARLPVQAKLDGLQSKITPGELVVLAPGESICLEPGVYHRFYGQPGSGPVLVGEVSQVNDDDTDNRFHITVGRFPEIEEDEPPRHLLVKDYAHVSRFVALPKNSANA